MKKINIKKAVTESLELPGELVTGDPKITITDFSELEVLNYQSLIEYTNEIIRINTRKKLIRIEGKNLFIKNITDGELTICGEVENIFFE